MNSADQTKKKRGGVGFKSLDPHGNLFARF